MNIVILRWLPVVEKSKEYIQYIPRKMPGVPNEVWTKGNGSLRLINRF